MSKLSPERQLLQRLVDLKDRKDRLDNEAPLARPDHHEALREYRQEKDAAWAEARDLLAQPVPRVTGDDAERIAAAYAQIEQIELRMDKRRAEFAQPSRPQWTDTPPTQPGWYWWRESAYSPVCAMFGDADHDGDGTIQHWWNGSNRLIYGPPDGQWCGPIAPPEE